MHLEKLDLEGRSAIVTGSGQGLGRGMALALARAGCDVAVADLIVERSSQVAEEIKALGRKAVAISCDVTDLKQVKGMVERVLSEFGKIDVLMNNVGGVTPGMAKAFFDLTPQDWRVGMDVNLTGAFYCSQVVGKHMVERQRGKIINTASGMGLRGYRSNIIYGTAKGGVVNFTRSLALAFARSNVQVNAIAPGMFPARQTGGEAEKQRRKTAATRIPLGRVGVPNELGGLAVFLASDASNYITGQIISVDGGGLAGGYAPFPTGYHRRGPS